MDRNEELRQWFAISEQNLQVAKHLIKTMRPTPDETICNNCQQSVEKYLKGYLFFNNVVFDKIHNLSQLLAKCIAVDADFKIYAKQCAFLSKYAVMPRYPNNLQISYDDAASSIRFADDIKNFVLSKVVLPHKPT
jgi:HEPN domain-containing protein